ncbi:CHASE3 domain-containing protein [Microcoleus sp. AT13-A5]
MLLGYAVPISLFVGLVIPVFSSASKVGESYRQTTISITAIEGTDRMGFYLAQMVGDTRGYILNRDEDYLKDYQNNVLKFHKLAESLGNTIENPSQKERLKKIIDFHKEYYDYSGKMIIAFLRKMRYSWA